MNEVKLMHKGFSFSPQMLVLMLPLFFILSSCLSKTEQIVPIETRASNRWDALISSDFEKAYKYETPEYRDSYSLLRFVGNFGGQVDWTSAEVKGVKKINQNLADVSVLIKLNFEGLPLETKVVERWILKDNKWWHVQK